jgi:hypothetical protein
MPSGAALLSLRRFPRVGPFHGPSQPERPVCFSGIPSFIVAFRHRIGSMPCPRTPHPRHAPMACHTQGTVTPISQAKSEGEWAAEE